jgi:hypothetical protein
MQLRIKPREKKNDRPSNKAKTKKEARRTRPAGPSKRKKKNTVSMSSP